MKKDKTIPNDITNLKGSDPRFADWHKSPLSANSSECVEVGKGRGDYAGFVGVRDSKNPDGPALAFTPKEWAAFVGGVKDGNFDKA